MTSDGAITVIPTPGHTSGHASVVVRRKEAVYFLAGDTSYTEDKLLGLEADAVTSTPAQMRATQEKIAAFARTEPVVYLPSHDVGSVGRLRAGVTLAPEAV